MIRFYFHKIGEHAQELAVLAIIFIPLERRLTSHQVAALLVTCGAILLGGIEMERRTR